MQQEAGVDASSELINEREEGEQNNQEELDEWTRQEKWYMVILYFLVLGMFWAVGIIKGDDNIQGYLLWSFLFVTGCYAIMLVCIKFRIWLPFSPF
jgi:hypothetical protein